MQHIPRIVRNAQDYTLIGRYIANARHDLLGAGARKDIAAHGGREHAVANISSPCGLVARSAAGNDGDLGGAVREIVDDAVGGVEGHVRVARCEGGEHVGYHALGRGEEVFA